jgi:hypothetical protein
METTVTKEYVAGGVNVITTTVEFIPQDVIDSRLTIAQEEVERAQANLDQLQEDAAQVNAATI